MKKQDLLVLLHNTLPISDLYSVPETVLESYADHAIFLRKNSPFCKDIPEEIFLHFVFYPRVNSEPIEDCRPFFYKMLENRVKNKSGTDAALEVNRWCGENMTYESSDDRTESPITAYFSGLGRCGEESTFAVTALRSVGIPARQIYVPWWAHCDDNHAWVEVYVDGDWHFLGACEPEPVLDRGWFLDASSRAPMACYRTFFPCNLNISVGKRGCAYLYSVIDRYAETSPLTVRTEPGAMVRLSVVNMSDFRTIATGFANENGHYTINLGRGTYLAESAGKQAAVTLGDRAVTVVPQAVPDAFDADFLAPVTTGKNAKTLFSEQIEENSRILKYCAKLRKTRIDSYFIPEYETFSPEAQRLLHLAAGNAPEIAGFLKAHPGQLALDYLNAIAKKDLKDVSCDLLTHHWNAAMVHRDKPHFVEEILNPRIGYESLTSWRGIGAGFPDDPEELAALLEERYPARDGRYYLTLTMTPEAVLKAGCADDRSRELLFCAICRDKGIPARRNPADGDVEYWANGTYHRLTAKGTGSVIPEADGNSWKYGVNFSIAKWTGAEYLPLEGVDALEAGDYRLVTANRLPNGNQLCRVSRFSLAPGQTRMLQLSLRQAAPEQMLANSQLEPFTLANPDGTAAPWETVLPGTTLLIYPEPGREPTEHILRELMAAKVHPGTGLAFVLQNREALSDPILGQTLETIPDIKIYFDTGCAGVHARKLFQEPGVYPLVILTDETRRGYFGSCGYNVGAVELALKLAGVVDGRK